MRINIMNENIIPIVFATNEKYAPFADVCIESIAKNSSSQFSYIITVFHTDLNKTTISKLEKKNHNNIKVLCLNISTYLEDISDKLYSHSYFSKEMYYRILIPRLFQDYEKVIYLDCDMVVLGDLSELYKIDLKKNMLAACRNLMHNQMHKYITETLKLNPDTYFNSGMLVFNIKYCFDLENCLWDIINSYGQLLYPDQDLLNIVCKDKVLFLDNAWNWLFHLERLQNSKNINLHLGQKDWEEYQNTKKHINILHYTGDKKPWDHNSLPMANLFWKYASCSNFYNDILKSNLNINKTKFQLQFIDFEKNNITLTCCLILARGLSDTNKIILNGNILAPCYSYIEASTFNDNFCLKKFFKINIPYKSLKKSNKLYFTFNAKPLIFEYAKFFPLNGVKSSYFAYNGYILYRNDRELVIEKSSKRKKFLYEIKYLKDLSKSNNLAKKSFLARLFYFALKPLIKHEIILINDRPAFAGDNGEAMFRYLNDIKPKKTKTYFVISKNSKDYNRLKTIGSVVPIHSLKLKILNLFANAKLSSQTDYDVYTIINGNFLKDILYKTNRVFLQHGITKDDISKIYSRYFQGFDLFITAAKPEYKSIIENKAYGCPEKITKLTGFARHDLLKDNHEKIILISPTWRKYLLKDINTGSLSDDFETSEFYLRYKSLFEDQNFLSFLKQNGYKIYFVLHNMLREALPYFQPFFNEQIENAIDKSFSELFSKAAIMITDYSSNAFEFAYLKKPVIYFQFDKNIFFQNHTYQEGYFSYSDNGFGPIVTNTNELKNELKLLIKNNAIMNKKYIERIYDFFAFNDKNNCERIWKEVKNANKLYY